MTAAEQPTDSPDNSADPGVCPWCAKPVPQHSGAGRPRVWCSDQCRRDAYNARKAARSGAVGVKVVRQTRTVEKKVEVRVPDWRMSPAAAAEIPPLDDHDMVLRVLSDPKLVAKVFDSFSASLSHRRPGQQFVEPLHASMLQLVDRLEDYRRDVAPEPEPTALSRQQRRALDRQKSKKKR